MQNENPLSYFEIILQSPDRLKNGCGDLIDFTAMQAYQQLISIDANNQTVTLFDDDDSLFAGELNVGEVTRSFAQQAQREIREWQNKAIVAITAQVATKSIEEAKIYLYRTSQTIIFLLDKFDEYYKERHDLKIVKVALEWIKSELERRYKEDFCIAQTDNKSISSQYSQEKIKWNGGVSALTTLFYELRLKHFGRSKTTYLEASDTQLIEFINNNFVDDKGEPFDGNSVKRYINSSDKKAKRNKIELDNFPPKI